MNLDPEFVCCKPVYPALFGIHKYGLKFVRLAVIPGARERPSGIRDNHRETLLMVLVLDSRVKHYFVLGFLLLDEERRRVVTLNLLLADFAAVLVIVAVRKGGWLFPVLLYAAVFTEYHISFLDLKYTLLPQITHSLYVLRPFLNHVPHV